MSGSRHRVIRAGPRPSQWPEGSVRYGSRPWRSDTLDAPAAPEAASDDPAVPPRARTASSYLALDGLLRLRAGAIAQRIFGLARRAEQAAPDVYEVVTCSVRPPGPGCHGRDFEILVGNGPEALATADTVVVPAS
ncbi:hypothetical protein STENM36S_04866 [Streptomyces tendae]